MVFQFYMHTHVFSKPQKTIICKERYFILEIILIINNETVPLGFVIISFAKIETDIKKTNFLSSLISTIYKPRLLTIVNN